MKDEYAIAYAEVLEILKYIPEDDYKKVPIAKIELFEKLKDKNSLFQYDPSRTLNEQNVSSIAKAIIALLFRDHWATPDQRELILKKEEQDRQKEKLRSYKDILNNNV